MTAFFRRALSLSSCVPFAFLANLGLGVSSAVEIVAPEALAAIAEIDRIDFAELLTRTAGNIRAETVAEHGGDFAAYWQAGSSGFEGKAFEAIVAATVNQRHRACGDKRRLIPIAAFGHQGDAADLVMVNGSGDVDVHVQAKLGLQAVKNAIGDARYAGMEIVTCQETLDALRAEVYQETMRSAEAGVSLSGRVKTIADALETGRVWTALPCGAPLPERTHVATVTRAHYSARFPRASRHASAAVDAIPVGTSAAVPDPLSAQGSEPVRVAVADSDDVTRSVTRVTASSVDDASVSIGRRVARWAGPIAIAVEIGLGAFECHSIEVRHAAGAISDKGREVAHARVVGGVGGGSAGGACGAFAGAAIGTAICPGPGTVVGAFVGGVSGGIGGGAAGRILGAEAMEAVHDTGMTAADAADWGGDIVYGAYRWIIGK